jgi:peptidoglycan/xylan/chitin deacetylase (PgdA/CDA1 family)
MQKAKLALRSILSTYAYYSGNIKLLQQEAITPWRILMYHRIINPEDCLYPLQPGMYVRPSTFEKHIHYLANNCKVISLNNLIENIEANKSIEPSTVVITFDDGWLDNYLFAFPVLRKYKMPATIFLSTAFVGSTHMFWTDRLSLYLHTIWQSRHNAGEHFAQLLTDDVPKELIDFLEYLLTIPNKAQLDDFIDMFSELLKKNQPDVRSSMLTLIEQLSSPFLTLTPERVFLNWDEIMQMHSDKIDFGSHSERHIYLTDLTEDEIKAEIENSFSSLRSYGITPSPVFCYPGGMYNENTQRILSNSGIKYALQSTRDTIITDSNSTVLLGRYGIHEDVTSSIPMFTTRIWGGEKF